MNHVTVYSKNPCLPHAIKIQCAPHQNYICFKAVLIQTDQCLGSLFFEIKPLDQDRINPYRGLGPHMFIRLIEGSEEYTGVGTHLMQAAMEYGLIEQDCCMRVQLDATHNSHPFFWNLGFRAKYQSTNDEICERVLQLQKSGKKREDFSSPASLMLLYLDSAAIWRQRIVNQPLLSSTVTLLTDLRKYISEQCALVFQYL